MAKRQLQDAEGNWHEIDDEVSLLGPSPKPSPESNSDSRYQPIKYDHTGGPAVPPEAPDPHSLKPQPQPKKQGWGNGTANPVDSDEFRKLWDEKNKGNFPV